MWTEFVSLRILATSLSRLSLRALRALREINAFKAFSHAQYRRLLSLSKQAGIQKMSWFPDRIIRDDRKKRGRVENVIYGNSW